MDGKAEKRLGALLPEVPNDFHIITKVGEAYDKETGRLNEVDDTDINFETDQDLAFE